MVGEAVKHYRVLEKIGEGGMGVVYKALDTRLDRTVAIKALHSMSDPGRRLQFAWEARAAAGLRHPHIVVIHDIVSQGEADLIVMEYIPGRPLSEDLRYGPIPVAAALRYARELASALETAHAAGIVHRDLKPSNILLTPEGSVKLVDFGLARLQRRNDEDSGAAPTIAGTYGYMSPEQTQGEPATASSDVFSFGALLYEMVTGRPTFQGSSPAAVLAAVLRDDPPPVAAAAVNCPPALAKIIEQCLRKDPKRRYQHMGDVRLALEEVSPGGVRWKLPSWWSRAAAIAGVGATLVAAQWLLFNRSVERVNSAPMPLTSFPGEERDAAWSPDGRQVAFTGNVDAPDMDIYVVQPGSSQTLRLTADPGPDEYPAWSPDGRWIAYRHIPPDGSCYQLRIISSLGGPSRTLVSNTTPFERPSWTSDSRALLFEDRSAANQPRAVFALWLDTGKRRQLTSPPANIVGDLQPAISPDGKSLAFCRKTAWRTAELYMLDLGPDLSPNGVARRETNLGYVEWPAWAPDGSRVVFGARSEGVGIWQIDRSGKRALPVSGVPLTAAAPTLAKRPGGYTSLVFTNDVMTQSIWRYPTDRGPEGPAVELVPSTRTQTYARYSNDGTRLAFSSTRSGYQEIWVANADGSQPVQLTNLRHLLSEVGQWSPTDDMISFVSQERDRRQIYIVPPTGGPAMPVTNEAGVLNPSGWSPDGKRLYYDSHQTGRREVRSAPPAGGDSEQVTFNGGCYAIESEPGVLYYWGGEDGKPGPLMLRESGQDRQVPLDPPSCWGCEIIRAPGGFLYRGTGPGGVYRYQKATGRSIRVMKDPGKPFWAFTVSPDEKWFASNFPGKLSRDLMIVEHFQ